MNVNLQIKRIAEALNPLDGKTNAQARKIAFNIMNAANKKNTYSDTYWEGPNQVFKALALSGLDFDHVSNRYGAGMKYKEWKITVKFINNNKIETTMHGTVTAHLFGPTSDPTQSYDMTIQIY